MNGLVLCLLFVVAVAAVSADGPKVTEKVRAECINYFMFIYLLYLNNLFLGFVCILYFLYLLRCWDICPKKYTNVGGFYFGR